MKNIHGRLNPDERSARLLGQKLKLVSGSGHQLAEGELSTADLGRVYERKSVMLRLAAAHGALLLLGLAMAKLLLLPYLTISDLQANWLLAYNAFAVIVGGWFLGYAHLETSRFSLGKSVCLLALLLVLYVATLAVISAKAPLIFWVGLVGGGAAVCFLSAVIQCRLAQSFNVMQPKSLYYDLEQRVKRLVDFVVALLGLVLISPLMALVAVLVFLECRTNPIIAQERVGKGEKTFTMYKFRSMVKNAHIIPVEALQSGKSHREAQLYKCPRDPRITPLGRILRKLSIDELPQLWNVVRGEMSLVGPRPPLVKEYEQMNHYHRRKFECTPGITGLWQVIGRAKNQRNFSSVAAYDTFYVENWSLMTDLRILLKTIPVVLLQKGAC